MPKNGSKYTGVVAQALELVPGNAGPADWQQADCQSLLAAISAAATAGGALRLGYTRDGGAYAIGIYGDGDPYTVYVRPSENLDHVLDCIADGFRNLQFATAPEAKGAKKGRT